MYGRYKVSLRDLTKFTNGTPWPRAVDANLKILVWSEGCVEATRLSRVMIEDNDVAELPWSSEADRSNVREELLT